MMSKLIDRRIAFSILIGLVVTTVSGMWVNSNIVGELPDVQFITQPLVGAVYWGYVLPWLRQPVVLNPIKSVIWQNFVADVFIWAIVGYIVLTVFKMPIKGKAKVKARPKRRAKPKRRRRRR